MMTEISPSLLMGIAPQLVLQKTGVNPEYNFSSEQVISTAETWYDGHLISKTRKPDPTHPQASEIRRKALLNKQWGVWKRPDGVLPDVHDPDSVIPEVVTASYGEDPDTGEALTAFGAVRTRAYTGLDLQKRFRLAWTRDLEEALAWHKASSIELDNVKRELAELAKQVANRQSNAAQIRAMMRPKSE
jgi:hypothetical protein